MANQKSGGFNALINNRIIGDTDFKIYLMNILDEIYFFTEPTIQRYIGNIAGRRSFDIVYNFTVGFF